MTGRITTGLSAVAVGVGVAVGLGGGVAAAAPDDSAAANNSAAGAESEAGSPRVGAGPKSRGSDVDAGPARPRVLSERQANAGSVKAVARKEFGPKPSVAAPQIPVADVDFDAVVTSPTSDWSNQNLQPIDTTGFVAPESVSVELSTPEVQRVARATSAVSALRVASSSAPEVVPNALLGALNWWTSLAAAVQSNVRYFLLGAPVTAVPSQLITDDEIGFVLGTLNASSDPRDRLSYTVTGQPLYGSVEISEDGIFSYVPTDAQEIPEDGLDDSFTVAIRSSGFNLRSLFGLLNPALNSTVVTVPVSLEPVSAPVLGAYPRTFTISNYSATPYQLVAETAPEGFDYDQIPREFLPGDVTKIKLNVGDKVELAYAPDGADSSEWIRVSMEAKVIDYWSGYVGTYVGCQTSKVCTAGIGGPPVGIGDSVVFMDNPGTEVVIDDPLAQAAFIERLGLDSMLKILAAQDHVKYKSVKRDPNAVGPLGFWNTLDNGQSNSTLSQAVTMTSEFSATESISVSASVGIELLSIISASISAEYGHSVTKTHSFSQQTTVTVPPLTNTDIYVAAPVIRYTGFMTIQMGNTKFSLPNVSVEEPDPNRPLSYKLIDKPVPQAIEA